MQHQPKILMLHKGEKTVRAVARPLDQNRFIVLADQRLNIRMALMNDPQIVSVALKKSAISLPSGLQGFNCVMKQVNIPGNTASPRQDIKGRAAGNVTLPLLNTVGRYASAEVFLESGKSHWVSSPAR